MIKFVSDLAAGRWFSPGTPVSSTNKADSHDITEVVLKAALNTIIIITKSPKNGAIVIIANRYFDSTMHES